MQNGDRDSKPGVGARDVTARTLAAQAAPLPLPRRVHALCGVGEIRIKGMDVFCTWCDRESGL